MNSDNIGKIISILRQLPGDPKWDREHNDGMMQFYTIGLRDIPDEAVNVILESIIIGCCDGEGKQFRPSVTQIRAMWKQVSDPVPSCDLASDMAEIIRLMDKYGPAGARHRSHPEQWPVIRDLGSPPELALMSESARKTVDAMGGWVAMNEDPSPIGVWRGQFQSLYRAAVANRPSNELRELRLRHEASKRGILSEISERPDEDSELTIECIGAARDGVAQADFCKAFAEMSLSGASK